MENENADFGLTNENTEEWTPAQFWESDSMKSEQGICSIILYVDWESKEVTVETQMDTNSTSMTVWNKLASEYTLEDDTDFSRFAEFYKEKIQPLLQQIGEGFESEWNGSNWKGTFPDEFEDINEKIDTILRENVPKHNMTYFFSLRDSYEYGGTKQIVADLKSVGIDLLTADLNDEETMKAAVNAVTWNEGSDYILIDADVEGELKEIQEELNEEQDDG